MILKFGKYYGEHISQVPDEDILWLYANYDETPAADEAELERRGLLEAV